MTCTIFICHHAAKNTTMRCFTTIMFLLTFLLGGCLLQTQGTGVKAVRTEESSRLTIQPQDITGRYSSVKPGDTSSFPVRKLAGYVNVYVMNVQQTPPKSLFLTQEQLGENIMLFQATEADKNSQEIMLIPAKIEPRGLRLYPMFMPGNNMTAWNDKLWGKLCAQHGIQWNGQFVIARGKLSLDEYTAAVASAVKAMFAADALGEGVLMPAYELENFAEACIDATPERIRSIMGRVDINAVGKSGYTPLQIAVEKNNFPVAKILIDAKAEVHHVEPKSGVTLLMLAHKTSPEMVKMLLNAGVEVNTPAHDGSTALMSFARSKAPMEMIELLIAAGANVNVQDKAGRTALGAAVYFKNDALTQRLIALGAKADAVLRSSGQTLLMFAATSSQDTVAALLKAGADVNARAKSGQTALMSFAQSATDPENLRMLVEVGADLEAQDENGTTALGYALLNRESKVVEYLLQAGANINYPSKNGKSFLMQALLGKKFDLFRAHFGKAREQLTARDSTNMTLLHHATGDIACVQKLLESGADVNAKSNSNTTPLMQAVYAIRGEAVVEALLKAGANVNDQDDKKMTALMHAVYSNNVPAVQLLIAAKADVTKKNVHGQTALTMARTEGNIDKKIISLLTKAGQANSAKPAGKPKNQK